MENNLQVISPQETQEHSDSCNELIRQWLFRFGVEHKEDVAPRLPLWLEAFAGMDAHILESLFKRAMKTCKFFPKVSEILEPLRKAEETATPQAAIEAWDHVLALRRDHWNPDIPGHLARHVKQLSERVQSACRASGVFGEFETTDGLHIWAKKAFIESFVAWGETEQSKYLLPDGEIKNLLAGFAQTKALPSSSVNWSECRERGETYRAEITASPEESSAQRGAPIKETARVIDFEGRSAELRRQAELIQQKYPAIGKGAAR